MVSPTILVTGASRGIGLELVKQWATGNPAPKRIIAACRNPGSASDLQTFQESSPTPISILQLDVTSTPSIEAALDQARVLCPDGLNLLVNNAGSFPVKWTPEDFSFESMAECFKVNSIGPTIVTKTFLPLLLKAAEATNAKASMSTSKSAVVMMSSNLGSITNRDGPQSYPYYAYNASKAAINMVTKCLSLEYASEGILVACIHPGWVKTDMGGPQGSLLPAESVAHMIPTIAKMESGKFYNYDFAVTGKLLPW